MQNVTDWEDVVQQRLCQNTRTRKCLEALMEEHVMSNKSILPKSIVEKFTDCPWQEGIMNTITPVVLQDSLWETLTDKR